MDHANAPARLTPAQSAALRRARELAAELAELTAAVRAHLADRRPAEAESEIEAAQLKAGDMREAFSAAQARSGTGPRPRWAETLLGGE